MSRVCKKVAGLACLAFVAGTTIVASGLPSAHQTSATSSDVDVQFIVSDEKYMVEVKGIIDDSIIYSGATVKVKVNYAMASLVTVQLVQPDNTEVLVNTFVPTEPTGSFEDTLPVSDFGEYAVKVSGKDMQGNAMPGNAIAFRYKGASVVPPSEDGEDGATAESIKIGYGEGVCKIGVQAYELSDSAKTHPLINPEYITEVPPVTSEPGEVEIDRAMLGLGNGKYALVAKAYDCLSGAIIDSDETVIADSEPGVIEPPKTGAISILGVTVSQADYLVTGLVVFVLTAIFAVFLLNRRKKSTRRR